MLEMVTNMLQKLVFLRFFYFHFLNTFLFIIRADHYATMIELGMLGAITVTIFEYFRRERSFNLNLIFQEWLAPLPDRSLPNIKIREILISTLQEVRIKYFKGLKILYQLHFLISLVKLIQNI